MSRTDFPSEFGIHREHGETFADDAWMRAAGRLPGHSLGLDREARGGVHRTLHTPAGDVEFVDSAFRWMGMAGDGRRMTGSPKALAALLNAMGWQPRQTWNVHQEVGGKWTHVGYVRVTEGEDADAAARKRWKGVLKLEHVPEVPPDARALRVVEELVPLVFGGSVGKTARERYQMIRTVLVKHGYRAGAPRLSGRTDESTAGAEEVRARRVVDELGPIVFDLPGKRAEERYAMAEAVLVEQGFAVRWYPSEVEMDVQKQGGRFVAAGMHVGRRYEAWGSSESEAVAALRTTIERADPTVRISRARPPRAKRGSAPVSWVAPASDRLAENRGYHCWVRTSRNPLRTVAWLRSNQDQAVNEVTAAVRKTGLEGGVESRSDRISFESTFGLVRGKLKRTDFHDT